jgi:hypothetical protein
MKKNHVLSVALTTLMMLVLATACNKKEDTSFQTETITLTDSTRYVSNLTIEVQLPVANSDVAQAIRQQLVATMGERLTHVASPEGEQFFPLFSGDANDCKAMVDYYFKRTMALLDSLSKSDADEREAYIREAEELSEEEKAERIAEIPQWEYEYSLKLIADTTNYLVFQSQDYIYLGGAHGGVSGDGCLTFDKETGKLVEHMLDSTCTEALQPLLIEGLLSYFSDNEMTMSEEDLFDVLQIEGRQIPLPVLQPFPTKEGMVFTYQQYEIASYAAGMPSFTLPYDRLQPYLTPEALKVCRLYLPQ